MKHTVCAAYRTGTNGCVTKMNLLTALNTVPAEDVGQADEPRGVLQHHDASPHPRLEELAPEVVKGRVRVVTRVRNSNLGLCFFAIKCCVSHLSVDQMSRYFNLVNF